MKNVSYQRLVRARYNYFSNREMPMSTSNFLDEILELPHPEREEAFVVSWPLYFTEETEFSMPTSKIFKIPSNKRISNV